ncbi:isocitrate/isopropylmalate family dehydrogenase [Ruegeria sp. 6PALISEP08]|uniref:isocitrate/isopropylmalate family dehydrogenase n=1 Tax=Ruegeria sp. 6PALISEP08 TaxID=1225660 RepID=UPI0009F940ED
MSGQGIANALGAILSVATMFEHSFGRPAAADAIERAVDNFLNAGLLPPDLGGSADTATVTQAVLRNLRTDKP